MPADEGAGAAAEAPPAKKAKVKKTPKKKAAKAAAAADDDSAATDGAADAEADAKPKGKGKGKAKATPKDKVAVIKAKQGPRHEVKSFGELALDDRLLKVSTPSLCGVVAGTCCAAAQGQGGRSVGAARATPVLFR